MSMAETSKIAMVGRVVIQAYKPAGPMLCLLVQSHDGFKLEVLLEWYFYKEGHSKESWREC
jgi:hypothetical protein